MKTVFEVQFEKLVISSISTKKCTARKRTELFYEFYNCASSYYEDLCDALFQLSTGEAKGSLFITPAGRPYISCIHNSNEDRWLFDGNDIPRFFEDLHEQMDYFCSAFLKPKKQEFYILP